MFALMKIGADFLLHRWDREQDENGDVTLKSLLSRFTGLFTESAAGNFLFGSEVYSLVDNALNGKDYDVVSATNISAVNDLAGDVDKFVSELRKDTATWTRQSWPPPRQGGEVRPDPDGGRAGNCRRALWQRGGRSWKPSRAMCRTR